MTPNHSQKVALLGLEPEQSHRVELRSALAVTARGSVLQLRGLSVWPVTLEGVPGGLSVCALRGGPPWPVFPSLNAMGCLPSMSSRTVTSIPVSAVTTPCRPGQTLRCPCIPHSSSAVDAATVSAVQAGN